VIVPTHDRPRLLSQALASIQSQTVPDFECIVVDDGSSRAPELPDDARFRIVRSDSNIGVPAASNLALGQARGRYVAFLDDDDLWTKERLGFALSGLEHAPVSICWRADLDSGLAGRNRMLFGNVHDVILKRSIPTKGQIAVERDHMLPFDARLTTSSDVEWWLRASAVEPVHTVDAVGLLFRRHKGTRNSTRLVDRVRCRRLIFDIHRDYFEQRPAVAARFLYRTARLAQWSGEHQEAIDLLALSFRLRPTGRVAARLPLARARNFASQRSRRKVETVADQLLSPSSGSIEQTAIDEI
jgi:glycosyltransferase involved in cell wall biosynthesis